MSKYENSTMQDSETEDLEVTSGSSTLSNNTNYFPEPVKQFLNKLYKSYQELDLEEVQNSYEIQFNKVGERYFKETHWPSAESLTNVLGITDKFFLMLYNEMTFKQVFLKQQNKLSLQFRLQCFENYLGIFDHILKMNENAVKLDLPVQWLWDLIDEFIYQYESFNQYVSKLKSKKEKDLEFLKAHPNLWNTSVILQYLDSLAQKTQINQRLKQQQQQQQPGTTQHLFYMIGYFSLIGLCRVNCLIGNYYGALEALANVEIFTNKESIFSRIPTCYITTYYYVGFAYLMMKRYLDTIKCFTIVLSFTSRNKQLSSLNQQQQSQQNQQQQQQNLVQQQQIENLQKRIDKCFALLAIAISLCPQRVEESVHKNLREKYGEKIIRMQRGEEAIFEEMIKFACPKFITPFSYTFFSSQTEKAAPQTGGQQHENVKNVMRHHIRLFLNEVKQQQQAPAIRGYLKLYSSVPVSKLAKFLDMDDKAFTSHLLAIKHKTRQQSHLEDDIQSESTSSSTTHADLLASKWVSCSDVDFYVDKDTVHVAEHKPTKHYGEYFIRQATKLLQ